jgi:hypothetical protein
MPRKCRVVIIIKAMPNPSRKHGETVCCAGVTAEGEWKRLYPIRFRHLQDKFKRWDWVKFEYGPPKGDTRPESCRVYEDRLEVEHPLDKKERASLLNPLVTPSTKEAAASGMSLTLVRPINPKFKFRRKPPGLIAAEREGYRATLRQTSLLDNELEPIEPVPYAFAFSYEDAAGKHTMQCSDWETSAAFWKLRKTYGEQGALVHLSKTYNEEYPRKGVVFAMGTVKARPKQWLLLGVIRLDEMRQASLAF